MGSRQTDTENIILFLFRSITVFLFVQSPHVWNCSRPKAVYLITVYFISHPFLYYSLSVIREC